MKITTIILLLCFAFSFLNAAEVYSETLLKELKEKISKLELNSNEYKKVVKVYLRKFSNLKSKHTNTRQFAKSKRVKEIIASIKKGELNVAPPKKEIEKKVKKKKVVSSFIKEYFSEGLTDKNGKPIKLSQLSGKTIGIYFSAHWCGPCRAFTPSLVKFRDANKSNFEVVFVSSDSSVKKKKDYMVDSGMNWPSAKYKGQNSSALSSKFKVTGLPTLLIISPKGTLITSSGRSDITSNPSSALKKWQNKAK
ncbi:MAG: hypothetical protein COA79_03775 [Planctomycetota bacterium]|nr:MAG: hypothetical protein COA79_03775 [Planctomycetota bacterium]